MPDFSRGPYVETDVTAVRRTLVEIHGRYTSTVGKIKFQISTRRRCAAHHEAPDSMPKFSLEPMKERQVNAGIRAVADTATRRGSA